MQESGMNRMDADELFQKYMYIMCNKDAEKAYRLKSEAGEGIMRSYRIAKGIELVYSELESYEPLSKKESASVDYIEIMYIVEGRADFEMANRHVASAAQGDVCIFNSRVGARRCIFGDGGIRSINIIVLPDMLAETLNRIFETDEFEKKTLFRDAVKASSCLCFPATNMLKNIFSELLQLPEEYGECHRKLLIVQAIITLLDAKGRKSIDYRYFSGDAGNKVHTARKILGEDLSSSISIEELAAKVRLNRTTLQRVFRQMYGVSIFEYRTQARMQEAKNMLLDERVSVTEVAGHCGYANASKFSAAFKRHFGFTPTEWKANNVTCLQG